MNKGFTLIEMIGVLLIISILAAFALKAGGFFEDSAKTKVAEFELADLNRTAKILWTEHKLSGEEYDDVKLQEMELKQYENLQRKGGGYVISVSGKEISINRIPGTSIQPPEWRKGS